MIKFKDAIQHLYQMQVDYRDKQQRRFERQYRIVQPDASDDEIQRVLSTEFSGPIFGATVRTLCL
jgi:syntaxin 1B/2/3